MSGGSFVAIGDQGGLSLAHGPITVRPVSKTVLTEDEETRAARERLQAGFIPFVGDTGVPVDPPPPWEPPPAPRWHTDRRRGPGGSDRRPRWRPRRPGGRGRG